MRKCICLVFVLALIMVGVPASVLSYATDSEPPAAVSEEDAATIEENAAEDGEVIVEEEPNYQLRSSTETKSSADEPSPQPDTGGTIQTTSYGNHSGDLNDGGDIIGPSTITIASGRDVVYTFTPKNGYALQEVWIWNDKDRTAKFPDVPDGMKTDKNSKRILAGDGTNDTYESFDDDGDGEPDRYTYAFSDINSYNAIHVVWDKTLLEVETTTTGSGKDDPDTFNFRIRITRQDAGSKLWFPVQYNETGDPSIDGRFTDIGSAGWYGFSLTNGETLQMPMTWTNAGDKYEIEEIPKANGKYGTTYDWDIVGDAAKGGTLESDKVVHAEFTNNRKKDIDPKETTLTVKKVWSDGNSRHEADNVKVKIQQKIGDEAWSDIIRMPDKDSDYGWIDYDEGLTADLNAQNEWKHTFNDLPTIVPLGDAFDEGNETVDYRIVETEVNGKAPEAGTVNVTRGEGDDRFQFTVENNVNICTLKVTKKWKGVDPNQLTDEQKAEITFQIIRDNGDSTGFSYADMTEGSITITDLAPGGYTVKETGADELDIKGVKYKETTFSVEDGRITLENNKTQEVEITNIYISEDSKDEDPKDDDSKDDVTTGNVTTGDDMHMMPFILLMIASMLGLAATVLWRRRHRA